MDIDQLVVAREKIASSLMELEHSVLTAYDQFSRKYGVVHEHTLRIETYFSAIEKQRELLIELDCHIKMRNFDKLYEVTAKINAMSELIKDDARSLLHSINTGTSQVPDGLQVH